MCARRPGARVIWRAIFAAAAAKVGKTLVKDRSHAESQDQRKRSKDLQMAQKGTNPYPFGNESRSMIRGILCTPIGQQEIN